MAMADDPKESEAVRTERDRSSAWRSLAIIFGVGVIGTVSAIVFVMRNRPPGELESGYGKPVPAVEKTSMTWYSCGM